MVIQWTVCHFLYPSKSNQKWKCLIVTWQARFFCFVCFVHFCFHKVTLERKQKKRNTARGVRGNGGKKKTCPCAFYDYRYIFLVTLDPKHGISFMSTNKILTKIKLIRWHITGSLIFLCHFVIQYHSTLFDIIPQLFIQSLSLHNQFLQKLHSVVWK